MSNNEGGPGSKTKIYSQTPNVNKPFFRIDQFLDEGDEKIAWNDFVEMEADPAKEPLLQRVALAYLKRKEKDYMQDNFTGKIDSNGYLEPKNGNVWYKPSQLIRGGIAKHEIVEAVRELVKGKK